MNFIQFIASHLTIKEGRVFTRLAAVLAISSVALAVTVMEIAVSISQAFERDIQNKIVGFTSDLQIGGYYPEADDSVKRISLNDSSVRTLTKRMPQIERLSPFIQSYAILKSVETMEGVEMKGVTKTWDGGYFKNALITGNTISFPDSGYSSDLLVSKKLAEVLNVRVDDKIRAYFLEKGRIRMRRLVIKGIYETGMAELDRVIVFCDIRLLQRILNWQPDEVQGIEVYMKPDYGVARYNADKQASPFSYWLGLELGVGFAPEEVAKTIDMLLPQTLKARSVVELYSDLFEWLSLQHQNVLFIIVLMTVVAIVNLASVLIIFITERTSTIGILKALGATNSQVQRIFFRNAVRLIFWGILLGNLLGCGLLLLQQETQYFSLDQDSYFLKTVPISWPISQFITINLLVSFICIVSIYLPTYYVTRIRAVNAINLR